MGIKSVVVTGAGGFIGNHLVRYLLKKKYKVKALVKYNSKQNAGWLEDFAYKKPKNLEIVYGDVTDFNFMKKTTKNYDSIINLAALISIPHSYSSPETYISNNIEGTFNILNVAKENKLKKIVIISTSEVYGSAQYIPIDELHPLNAQSPYAASKIAADQLAMSFYRSFNLPVVIARPFNTFGPMQSTRAVIPSIIVQLAKNKKIINIGDTKPTRDFTYVEDTVAGLELILKSSKYNGEVFNIGSNFEISIGEIINKIKKITKLKFKIKIQNKRLRPKKSEVTRLYASNKKIQKKLKWFPKYSGKKKFVIGLEKTINWYFNKNNLKLYKKNINY